MSGRAGSARCSMLGRARQLQPAGRQQGMVRKVGGHAQASAAPHMRKFAGCHVQPASSGSAEGMRRCMEGRAAWRVMGGMEAAWQRHAGSRPHSPPSPATSADSLNIQAQRPAALGSCRTQLGA